MKLQKCNKCQEEITPRLWHEDMNSLFFNRSTQHICPFCGDLMYMTGGGLSPLGKSGFIIIFILIFLYLVGSILHSEFGFSENSALIGALVSLSILVFFRLKHNKKNKSPVANKKEDNNPWLQ